MSYSVGIIIIEGVLCLRLCLLIYVYVCCVLLLCVDPAYT